MGSPFWNSRCSSADRLAAKASPLSASIAASATATEAHSRCRLRRAGSAASVIACAGWCDMSPTAMMMVHNVSAGASGDYHDMERCAETLKKANAAMAAAYVAKTGMSEADALAMMDRETWMTAQDALDKKLVDAIAEPAPTALSMTAAAEGCLLSAETVERIRNTVKSPAARKLAAEIEIWKVKGETV